MDHNETEESMDDGEPVALDDPSLPPRARRELNRLANNGVGPTIYQGRTRSQTQHSKQSMTTNGKLQASTPLPYQHMTPFEKELFHRRIAGVRVPSEIRYEQTRLFVTLYSRNTHSRKDCRFSGRPVWKQSTKNSYSYTNAK